MEVDEGVQSTNDDACECKKCAVKLGYWSDKYVSYFSSKISDRKPPEINRGYFARTQGVSFFVKKFIKTAGEMCQIVSLGAGFDTLYWRLKEEGYKFANYAEIDFPSVTARKSYAIKRCKELADVIMSSGKLDLSNKDVHGHDYHLVAADLRLVGEVESRLLEAGISFDRPTVFIAECVLVYIESSAAVKLLSWIARNFSTAFFVNYEQVNMGDRFGGIMLDNLRARGCPLSGVDACASLQSQINRFINAGWDGAEAWTMVDVYNIVVSESERQRVESIELLDEAELLTQLLLHYCISVGFHGGSSSLPAWSNIANISPVNQ